MKRLYILILLMVLNSFGCVQRKDDNSEVNFQKEKISFGTTVLKNAGLEIDPTDWLDNYTIYEKKFINRSGIYNYSRQKSERYTTYLDIIDFREGYYSGSWDWSPEYEQYENILFFRNNSGKNLIRDRINSYNIYTNIGNIDSIIFSDRDTITIKGAHTVGGHNRWNPNRVGLFNEIEWVNTISEEIAMTFNTLGYNIYLNVIVTDEMVGQEIPKNATEGKSESFFPPVASKDNKYFLFTFFERNIVFDFTQFRYQYDNIHIIATYNTVFDEYYIFVDYYAGDSK